MSDERFAIALNLKRVAPSQYTNYNFNSMCIFNGLPIACNEDGIFSLDDSETDNGTEIDSYIELPTTDFGELRSKRFRKMFVGYETSGNLKVTVVVDGGTAKSFILTAGQTAQIQHRDILPMTRDQKGVYWVISIENVDGCDFSLDNIEGVINFLTKSRR